MVNKLNRHADRAIIVLVLEMIFSHLSFLSANTKPSYMGGFVLTQIQLASII